MAESQTMTEEERKNRNPKPEFVTIKLADAPLLTVADLELHHVYILHSTEYFMSMNYMGTASTVNPQTGEPVIMHVFEGPRAAIQLALVSVDDGKALRDGAGKRILIRKYTGEDR